MTLSFYVARRFIRMFLIVTGVFFAILFMVETIEQIRRIAGTRFGISEAMTLAILNVPGGVYRILPLITILATVGLFLTLARTSELVVIRAAGRSALRTLVAPVITALLIGAFAVAVLNPIVASTAKRADELSARYRLGGSNVISIGREGVWLRQGGEKGPVVIHARRANQFGTVLRGATFLVLEGQSRPIARYEAETAKLEPNAWVLSSVKEWRLTEGMNAEKTAVLHDKLRLPSDLTADQIRDSFSTPSVISVWDMPGFIDSLRAAGFSARSHQVWLQIEMALPLLLATMVVVGAGLTMRHARSGKTGAMALMTVIFGFTIFFLRNFTQILGENGQVPVLVAAWTPPVAAILLGLALVLHLEDG